MSESLREKGIWTVGGVVRCRAFLESWDLVYICFSPHYYTVGAIKIYDPMRHKDLRPPHQLGVQCWLPCNFLQRRSWTKHYRPKLLGMVQGSKWYPTWGGFISPPVGGMRPSKPNSLCLSTPVQCEMANMTNRASNQWGTPMRSWALLSTGGAKSRGY